MLPITSYFFLCVFTVNHQWSYSVSASPLLCIIFLIFFFVRVHPRSLTKARMKISNSSKMRDKLHNDISKVQAHTHARTYKQMNMFERILFRVSRVEQSYGVKAVVELF